MLWPGSNAASDTQRGRIQPSYTQGTLHSEIISAPSISHSGPCIPCPLWWTANVPAWIVWTVSLPTTLHASTQARQSRHDTISYNSAAVLGRIRGSHGIREGQRSCQKLAGHCLLVPVTVKRRIRHPEHHNKSRQLRANRHEPQNHLVPLPEPIDHARWRMITRHDYNSAGGLKTWRQTRCFQDPNKQNTSPHEAPPR